MAGIFLNLQPQPGDQNLSFCLACLPSWSAGLCQFAVVTDPKNSSRSQLSSQSNTTLFLFSAYLPQGSLLMLLSILLYSDFESDIV